jgi:hypothetical protein
MAQDILKAYAAQLPAKSIKLGLNDVIDLSALSDEQALELQRQHAADMVGLAKKTNDAKLDLAALDQTLGIMNSGVSKATRSNLSVNVSWTQKTTFGETEVTINNTRAVNARTRVGFLSWLLG